MSSVGRGMGGASIDDGLGEKGEIVSVIWYNAGGAPDPIAAYKPKGAASLAVSYVNLLNAGTLDAAPGVAPTLGAGGWTFNGSTQYLTTGIIPAAGWTVLVQFNIGTLGGLYGAFDSAGSGGAFLVNNAGAAMRSYSGDVGSIADNAPVLVSGNYGVSAKQPYRDGVAEATAVVSTSTYPTIGIFIAALNINGGASQFSTGDVAAFAAWNSTLTALQVLAVATAMAAL